jgi:hypothetical protein
LHGVEHDVEVGSSSSEHDCDQLSAVDMQQQVSI